MNPTDSPIASTITSVQIAHNDLHQIVINAIFLQILG